MQAVFLDKDGTLIEDVPYNVDPALIRLSPFVIEGLQILQQLGFSLFIVSNQSGLAKRLFSKYELRMVWRRIDAMLTEHGIILNAFYYCPHEANDLYCTCRKPMPGMLHRAAADHRIDLKRSWMVGDILDDVEAGRRAGCRTVLINNGNETEWLMSPMRKPHIAAGNLHLAAMAIAASIDAGAAEAPSA